MVTAYILIQTEVGKAARVARDIVEIKGVQQAEDVTGPYDVIVRAEARSIDELGRLVVARVQAVDGEGLRWRRLGQRRLRTALNCEYRV